MTGCPVGHHTAYMDRIAASLRTRYQLARSRARAMNDALASAEASVPSRLDVLDGVLVGAK